MNRSLLFVTMDKHKCLDTVEVFFTKHNFLHLTGLKVDRSNISAKRFFDMCINKKLSINDFNFADDGTTDLKLLVLPFLISKNLKADSIGEFNESGVDLYTEKLVGGVKGCIGVRADKLTGLLVPNTVLNKDIRECTKQPRARIIVTYRKNDSDKAYSEIVYTAKKIEWAKIQFPAMYSYLPKPMQD